MFFKILREFLGLMVKCTVFFLYYLMKMLFEALNQLLSLFGLILFQEKFFQNIKQQFIPEHHKEIDMTTEQFISIVKGYTITTHKITTEDNYILTAWRVSKQHNKKKHPYPVLLNHGLLDCSMSWFINKSAELCLPYILADLGYDVWVLNNRGNRLSLGHATIQNPQDDSNYWNYSFDELAKYDITANVKYVNEISQSSKVIYIGHSQGSTQFFAQLCLNPSFQDKIQTFIGLGPAIHIGNLNSGFVKKVFQSNIFEFLSFLGFTNFFVIPPEISQKVGHLCHYLPFLFWKGLFQVFNLLCGFPEINRLPYDLTPVIVTHEPGGCSIKNLLQWIQFNKTNQLLMFDHGQKVNLEKYGQKEPPSYKLENLKLCKIQKYLFIGTKDIVADPKDIEMTMQYFDKQTTNLTMVNDYAHLDYVWGLDAPKVLYQEIIKIIQQQK